MPDQPDDAQKRQQRGVFPPLFVPRKNGRGESPPAPTSGAWRRVSRLFTPPEGTRQRGGSPRPQTPATQPSVPAVEPLDASLPPLEGTDVNVGPAFHPTSTASPVGAPEDAAPLTELAAPPEAGAASGEVGGEITLETPSEASGLYVGAEEVVDAFTGASTYEDIPWPMPPLAELAERDSLPRFDPLAFDAEAEELVVQSLESEPISLEMPELTRAEYEDSSLVAGADASADASVGASTDATTDATTDASADASALVEELLYGGADSGDAPAVGASGFAGAPWAMNGSALDSLMERGADAAIPPVGAASSEDSVSGDSESDDILSIDELRAGDEVSEVSQEFADPSPEASVIPAAESDPWAGAELPEPAFGSMGWPSIEAEAVIADAEPAGAAETSVDEMSAALAWSDADPDARSSSGADVADGIVHGMGHGVAHSVADFAADDAPDGVMAAEDDALSAVAHELRHSSSAWSSASEVVVDEDTEGAARARFYSGAEHISGAEHAALAVESSAVAEPGVNEIGSEADDDAGAAIADALARVAARIRSGEVALPSDAVGASDESALAAALAALLRGPRH